jgi:hypothetical protein
VQVVTLTQAFKGCDLRAVRIYSFHFATADRGSIQQDEANATSAIIAAYLNAEIRSAAQRS